MPVEVDGKFDSAREIATVEEDIGFKVDAYLRSKGWTSTSATPGCYWMWKREIAGVAYMVHREQAVRIQVSIEDETAPKVKA